MEPCSYGIPRDADHLCVLIHGLWGSPSHMNFLAESLRERYGDQLHILVAKSNTGTLTYDGIDLGGERVAREIEETLNALADEGCQIKKLSVVGYSLGGLVARYALGLLDARGWLNKLEPVNFTTFASPHVGARIPLKGIYSHLWNNIGSRATSVSGHQLFMVDSFRESGRPMLSIMAGPDSIFIQALKKFKNRCLYANIVNDRSTVFYTTAMSTIDPFQNLENIRINYVNGYEPVIIDPDVYTLPSEVKPALPFGIRFQRSMKSIVNNLPFWFFIFVFFAIILPIFLMSSVVQTIRSRQRIRLHGEGQNRLLLENYRVPVMIQEVQGAVEEAYDSASFKQDPAYISGSTEIHRKETGAWRKGPSEKTRAVEDTLSSGSQDVTSVSDSDGPSDSSSATAGHSDMNQRHPTLALMPAQFAIIESLNSVGFRKYPVYIHNHRHSHAAIIMRVPKKGFEEAKVIVKHWLDKEFEI
ncbi:DUF676-domain-containing protein [Aspergillus avenaceus]|uniref:DUF676-domain-containing protein n=1 Tax=Aspergillus avenaceus TaxID=36643 RepID=A0A5N6TTY4_ASPAV|nr:DUF676-domain-containing protein [Aspergillus avenaceus]